MHTTRNIFKRENFGMKNTDTCFLFYGGRQPPSRKNFQNREKTFKIKKKILESAKYFSVKKNNYEIEKKKIKIKKNISESRKIFQNRENYFRIKKYFVRRIEKKSLELNVSATFLHNSFIACVRLVTVK